MNKLILALCFTTGKVAGFASYSGKECVLGESCQAASNVDGFVCAVIQNCQDNCPAAGTTPPIPDLYPALAGFGQFARFADVDGIPYLLNCGSDNTCASESCSPYATAAQMAGLLGIEDPFDSCAVDGGGIAKTDPLDYCRLTGEFWCDWWTIEHGLDDEYKSSLYWEASCSESSQINLCKPGSTCDSKEEDLERPAENCIFNPTCFCLVDSLQALSSGGGGGGPTCTPYY